MMFNKSREQSRPKSGAETDGSPGAYTQLWPKVDKSEFVKRVYELASAPLTFQQGDVSGCGPAVFFSVFAEYNKDRFVEFALDLLFQGSAGLGTTSSGRAIIVEPSEALRHQDFSKLQLKRVTPIADWVLMISLVESEVKAGHLSPVDFATHEGVLTLDQSAGMPYASLLPWLEAIGNFSNVGSTPFATRLIRGAPNSIDLSKSVALISSDVRMIIDLPATDMVRHGHIWRLQSLMNQTGAVLSFNYWSYGRVDSRFVDTAAVFDATNGYWIGAIICEV